MVIGQLLTHPLKGRSVRIESYSFFTALAAALKREQAPTREGGENL